MDSNLRALQGSFGAISTEFLAQKISRLNPPAPLTIDEDSPLRPAIELMQKHRIGSLLVVDKEEKLCGIFSERDVLTRVILSPLDLDHTAMKDIMTKNPVCETYDTSIAFVLRAMVDGRFRHVPIVDEERYPIGIVSIKDLLEFIEAEMVLQLAQRELGGTKS